MRKQDIEVLKSALLKELELYRRMLDIAEQQKERSKDVTFLFGVLRQKQELVIEIQKIDDQIVELKKLWRQEKTNLLPDERKEIEAVFSEIETVLEKLLRLEGILAEEIKRNQQELESQLCQVTAGKKAISAYYRKVKNDEARFVDRRQ